MFRSTRAKTPRTKLTIAAAILATGALILTGCTSSGTTATPTSTSGGPLKKVTLTLNFLAGGSNSGFMVAKEKGYYSDAGLDVTIQEGQGSNSTASVVAAGNSDFGFADGPSGITVASKGGDLLNIGPILQTNGFSVMALKDKKITKISDLKGKSVGLQPGTAQASLFDAVLAVNGLDKSDVNIVNIDPSALVGSLLQGRVDAITAGADSQGVQLIQQGAKIDQIYYKNVGVPTVGLSMITSGAYARLNPKVVKAFVSASLKGWAAAKKDPSDAATIVAKQFPAGATVDSIKAQFAVDASLLCASGAKGLGLVPDKNWTTTYKLMVKYLALPTTKPINSYYTTDYLPSKLPAC